MRTKFVWLTTLATFLLFLPYTALDRASIMNRFASSQDVAVAKNYFDLLRQNKAYEIEKSLDESLQGPATDSQFAVMAAMFPAGPPKSIKTVGSHWLRSGDTYTSTTTLEYEFPDKWLLADITTRKIDGVSTILGFDVQPLSDSIEHANRFTFTGKGVDQYVMLFMIFLDLAIGYYAFVLCLKTDLSNWKRLMWCLICLTGVGRLDLNWKTGATQLQVLWIGFPPAGAAEVLYGPWILYAAMPLGAILFLLKRESLSRSKDHSDLTSMDTGNVNQPLPASAQNIES